jgi:hypothetical protein
MPGITIREIPVKAKSEWTRILEEVNGTPLHLPDPWLTDNSPEDISLIAMASDTRVAGAAIAVRQVHRILRFISSASSLLMPAPPAMVDGIGDDREAAYRALLAYAKQKGHQSLVMEPRWGDDVSSIQCLAACTSAEVTDFVMDLRPSLDQILSSMHKKHRKNIKAASEAGILCRQDSSLDGMMILQTMQAHSVERGRDRGNFFSSANEDYFRKAYQLVYQNGPGRLYLAFRESRPVAALAHLEFGKKAITVRSGSSPEGYETSAMYLLQYELVRDLKERGFEELNIGGVPLAASESGHPQHGLFDYKRYYGGHACVRSRVEIKLA